MKKELPDEKVAAGIVADIRKEMLIPADRLASLQQKLASAGLDARDWILLAEASSNEG